MTRQIVLDTETTGLDASQGDRVIEIGCIVLDGRRVTLERFHVYLNPDREVSAEALRVHNIDNAFLATQKRFKDVVDEFLAFVKDAELIIHNAVFDVGMLDAELARLQRPGLKQHVHSITDTMQMARKQFPGQRKGLDALCQRFGIDNSHRELHGALKDAELLASVYLALTRGQEVLFDESSNRAATAQMPTRAHWDLPVLRANEAERAAHEAVLQQLDKSSGGKTLWRALDAEVKEAETEAASALPDTPEPPNASVMPQASEGESMTQQDQVQDLVQDQVLAQVQTA